jgi:site-specific DNA recombinase
MPSTNGHGSSAATERVALYLRVSSEEQRDAGTIKTQHEFLDGCCALHGLEVAGRYEDDGVSGTIPLHERPAGRRLLEDAREGKFDTVLVYRLDRLGRALLVAVDAHDRLEALGVGLRSAKEQIDTTTPSGRMHFQMLAGFAEFEKAGIVERTRDGLHRALRAGKQPGRVPYGYRIGDYGSFEVVEDEARIVAQIFANIAEGSTIYREVLRLNDEGIPAPGYRISGKERVPGEHWNSTTVSDMLASLTYIGKHEVKVSGANGGQEVIVREVPAIVTPALRERARRTLAENRRSPVGRDGKRLPARRRYLLSGLIRCEVCGNRCTAHSVTSSGRQWKYYACNDGRCGGERPRRGPKGHARFLRAHWLEEVVWADIRGFLENPGETLHRVRQELASADGTEELAARHADLTKRLAAKHKERDNYIRQYAREVITEAELDDFLADLRVQTENLRLLLESVEVDLARRHEEAELAASTEAWLMTLRERIHEVEGDSEEAFRARRQLVRLLVEGIIITDKRKGEEEPRVRITYRFDPPEQDSGDLCEVSRNTNEFLEAKARAGR